ncbi:MAG: ribonuclease R, partial [Bdellovibrionales bacterium]|nr:ribonuclease R [Bdellovibrionales bacterium]
MQFKHATSGKTIKGTVKRHPDGFGFVIPDDKSHQDIYIPASKMGSALTYDKVEALVQKRRHKKIFFGSIKAILKRHWEWTSGPYEVENGNPLLRKHGLPINQSVQIQNPHNLTVKKGEWVKVKLTSFPTEEKPLFQGDLMENLGVITSSAKDDNSRILAEHNIPLKFPKTILEELKTIPDEVKPEDWKGRRDLTDKAFVTIDGATAKDFDDAIFVEKCSFGFRLWVAIADVSHYVQEDSPLDKEAYLRGNSTYLPDQAIPMLPEKLSNGLCSLNPHVPRLAMVAEMDFDVQGVQLKSQFYSAVIKSHHRLTYGQAQDIFDNSDEDKKWGFLKDAARLGHILIQSHNQNGALDFNIPEISVKVNAQGEPIEIIKEFRLFSHKLIEQFMLSANQAVSLFLKEKKLSALYRIHESPEKESLKQLDTFSKSLGFSSPLNTRQNLLAFLKKFKGHSSESLINKLTLRALSQARYSAFNKGHYGLNFPFYTHFTSPIRRYCDLTIHRLIRYALNHTQGEARFSENTLEKQARWISEREQISVKAERKVTDIKKARFLKPYVGEEFDGSISTVTSFGLFIALEKFDVEGLVRFRDLPGHWIFDEANMRAESKRSRYSMQFGDSVRIQVITANIETGTIDFKLISHKNIKTPVVSKTGGRKKTSSGEKNRDRKNSSRSRHYNKKRPENDSSDFEKPNYKRKRTFNKKKPSDKPDDSRPRTRSRKRPENDNSDFEKPTYKRKRTFNKRNQTDKPDDSRPNPRSRKRPEDDNSDFEKPNYK